MKYPGIHPIHVNSHKISNLCSVLYNSNALLIGIVLVSFTTRFTMYLSGRSFWIDEAMLVLNITDRSFVGLFHQLDYHQGAPIGFLLVEKLVITYFGDTEYAFRLFPLICGGLSVLLFYKLAKYCIETQFIPIALFLFAISSYLIYYSSEVKQYSCDVTITILLYILILNFQSKKCSWRQVIYLGLVGAISIWFSHPATLILAGLGSWLILQGLMARDRLLISQILVACAVWMCSFLGLYHLSLSHIAQDMVLLDFWKSGFMPFPPRSITDIKWFTTSFLDVFKFLLGLSGSHLQGIHWALLFLIGSTVMWKKNIKLLSLLISPLPFILLASGMHRYPFSGRLILFIIPVVILLISKGIGNLYQVCPMHYKNICIAFIGIIVLYPFYETVIDIIKHREKEEVQQAVRYIDKYWESGDVLYVYYSSIPAFKYYSKKYNNVRNVNYIVGIRSRDNCSEYSKDLDKLRGNERVWVLISHNCNWRGVDEEKLFINYLNHIGVELQHFKATGASVYLYNLECSSN